MSKLIIPALIAVFGISVCVVDSAKAQMRVTLSDVHISPTEPEPVDVITVFASGGLAYFDIPFDHSEFSINQQSLQLDLYFGNGYSPAIGDWSHSEEIGMLPAETYTLTVRTFEPRHGLNDTYTTSFTVVVPEPTTVLLLAVGIIGIQFSKHKTKHNITGR